MPDHEAAKAIFNGLDSYMSRGPSSVQTVNIIVFDAPKLPTFRSEQMKRGVTEELSELPPRSRTVQLGNDVTLSVEQGDITTDSSDVIVAPMGVVFNAVARKSDQSKKELRNKHRGTPSPLADISAGGQLLCKRVYAITLIPRSSDNDDECIRNLQDVVDKCLQAANKGKYSSIAIPTIGTGGLKYDTKHATAAIVKASKAFAANESTPSLSQIKISVFEVPRVTDVLEEVQHQLGIPATGPGTPPKVSQGFFQRVGNAVSSFFSSSSSSESMKPRKKRRVLQSFSAGEPDVAVVAVFAPSVSACNSTHSAFRKLMDLSCITKTETIKDSVPEGFDTSQLKSSAAKSGVALSFLVPHDKGSATKITLSGYKDDVADMHTTVLQQLALALREEVKTATNERILEVARWSYEVAEGTFKEYSPEVTVKLERALEDGDGSRVRFWYLDCEYEVDLHKWEQRQMLGGKVVAVKRERRSQGQGKSFNFVNQMNDSECAGL